MIVSIQARKLYPVQIQGDNVNAEDAFNVSMCHVFDIKSEICIMNAMQKEWLHVVAWDADGNKIAEYDNR